MSETAPRILVIRRDNIGDLVCTLPLIRRLRECYPEAWIGALVTRYNLEVLHDNPDLDAVFSYTKRKHLAPGESATQAMLARLRQLWQLRRQRLDWVLLPSGGESARRMAWLVGAKRVLSAEDVREVATLPHEVMRVGALLNGLGLPGGALPPALIRPRSDLRQRLREQLATGEDAVLGLHISARKPSQRWPVERFVSLIQALHAEQPALRFALFWSPGDENNPLHPGDDGKAAAILQACAGLPVAPVRTASLAELIAGLSLCSQVVCSDGGHMHLAAALGKPLVCLFGKSDAARWHPWGVPFRLLQPASQEVGEVSVEAVRQALAELTCRDDQSA